jgi:hypothetical protein
VGLENDGDRSDLSCEKKDYCISQGGKKVPRHSIRKAMTGLVTSCIIN